ncbi:MAG TPA: carboxylating nicotinate-nucleotide diphosphorylase [Acidimicrobiia bacterium]
MNIGDYADIVENALREDLAGLGDITSDSVIPPQTRSEANLVARGDGVIAGLEVAAHVFARVDDTVVFEPVVADGDRVATGTTLALVTGPSRSILTAERTALNLLARMSGVATATAELVERVAGTSARITDTRKTMPGLRVLDKYAVIVGGGVNHRMGLYDEVMIKDNHIVAAGDISTAVTRARESVGPAVKIVVEVESLDQVREVLETDADRVLLDNLTPAMLREAVEMTGGRMETEASGGVTRETVRSIAETGVGFISVGWITHSAPQLDIALDFAS